MSIGVIAFGRRQSATPNNLAATCDPCRRSRPLLRQRISNRHQHGLETLLTLFAFNKTTRSNRHSSRQDATFRQGGLSARNEPAIHSLPAALLCGAEGFFREAISS